MLPVGAYLGNLNHVVTYLDTRYGVVGLGGATATSSRKGVVAVLVPLGARIEECIAFLRELKEQEEREGLLERLFVVDDGGRLCGWITMGDLLVREEQGGVANVMRMVELQIQSGEKSENAVRKIREFGDLCAPVVDEKKRIVGVVTLADMMRDNFQDEILRFEGVSSPIGDGEIDERAYFDTSIKSLVQGRAYWLVGLLLLQSVSSSILSGYSNLIEQNVVIAWFLTMVVGAGGNAGNQSSALVIRGLATGDIDSVRDFWRVIAKESKVGIILAGFLSVVSFGRVYISTGSSQASITSAGTVSGALFLIVVSAVLAGSTTPMIFERLGVDPCYFASPFLATVTDIGGVLLLCSLATITMKPAS